MSIIDKLSGYQLNYKIKFIKMGCLIYTSVIWFFIGKMDALWNIAGAFLDIIGYYVYLMMIKRQGYVKGLAIVMGTQIINQIGALLVITIVSSLSFICKNNSYYVIFLILGYFMNLCVIFPVEILCKKYKVSELLNRKRLQYTILNVGIFFQIAKVIIRINHKNTDNILLYIALTTIVMGIIFGTLWVIDWYYNEREKRLLWEDNHRMSQRLHKSKEIVPALSVVLEELKSNKESGEFNDILDEIHQLCKEQIEEHEKLAIQNKSFPTTESHVLDERLQLYEIEAVEKNINFDVFVGISMKQILKEKQIKELDVLQIIGDLIRNAFRAIERTKQDGGNILLVMGCVGEVLQIDVYDSGAPFPMFVLNEFGKRGNTEGGTGNGLTDVLELLEKYQATFLLTEYNHGAVYSKGISIIWDHKNQRRFDSARRSQLSKDSSLFSKES